MQTINHPSLRAARLFRGVGGDDLLAHQTMHGLHERFPTTQGHATWCVVTKTRSLPIQETDRINLHGYSQ